MYVRNCIAILLLLATFWIAACDGDTTGPRRHQSAYLEGTVVDAEGAPLAGAFVTLNFTVESSDPSDESPAPFRVGIGMNWQEAQGIRLEILDLQRRRVNLLHEGLLPAGPRVLVWDGRDGAQEPAPEGIYLLAETPIPQTSGYPATSDHIFLLAGERPRLLMGLPGATTDADGHFRFILPLPFFPGGGSLSGVDLDGQSLGGYFIPASVDVIAVLVEEESVRYTERNVPILDRSQSIEVELTIRDPS